MDATKYYWCSLGFAFSAILTLICNHVWLSTLFIIISIFAVLFGLFVEKDEI